MHAGIHMKCAGGRSLTARDLAHLSHAFRQLLKQFFIHDIFLCISGIILTQPPNIATRLSIRVGIPACLQAGMACLNHWIPRPSFQTRLYHLHPCRRAFAGMTAGGNSGLRRAAMDLLGGLLPTPLYHLHPCRRASMQACP